MSSLYDLSFQKQCDVLFFQLKTSKSLEETIESYYHILGFLTEKRGHMFVLYGFEKFKTVIIEKSICLKDIDVNADLALLEFRIELMKIYEQFLYVKNEKRGKKRGKFQMTLHKFLSLVQNNLEFLPQLSQNEYVLIHNFLELSKELFEHEKIQNIESSHSYSLLRLKYTDNSK